MHFANRTKIKILRACFNSFSTVIVAEVKLEVTVKMQMSVLSRLCCKWFVGFRTIICVIGVIFRDLSKDCIALSSESKDFCFFLESLAMKVKATRSFETSQTNYNDAAWHPRAIASSILPKFQTISLIHQYHVWDYSFSQSYARHTMF